MIRLLEGTLRHRTPDYVVVGCGGVGYQVRTVPLLSKLGSVGQAVVLWIHTQVRDDAISLFGFEAHEDLELFETLISINGVGAKIAGDDEHPDGGWFGGSRWRPAHADGGAWIESEGRAHRRGAARPPRWL